MRLRAVGSKAPCLFVYCPSPCNTFLSCSNGLYRVLYASLYPAVHHGIEYALSLFDFTPACKASAKTLLGFEPTCR